MAAALPFVSAGLGIYQTVRGQQMQQQAVDEARRPRLSPEQQGRIRQEGTSNISSNLAARGLGDSSLLTGGLANLEEGIAEATANAGTAGDVSGILSNQAMGLSQGGGGLLGNAAEAYMLQRMLGGNNNPFMQQRPISQTNQVWSGQRPIYDDYLNPYAPVG